jgi:uncharacterized membrane protein
MGKWLKGAFLAALLIGAGYFFGTVCKQVGSAYELLLTPSADLLDLLLWVLLALGAVAVTAGLVAALLRPAWVGMIAFALSGSTLLLGWQVTPVSGILALVYVLVAFLYVVGVARELNERTQFSVRPISEGQAMLLIALTFLACGSLYTGTAETIAREGFSIPKPYIDLFVDQMESQIEARLPEENRQEAVAQFREEFRRTLDDFFDRTVKPYERFVPFAIAGSLFMPLIALTRLLAWIPTLFLRAAFSLLASLGVTRVVSERQEVQKLVIA